MEGKRLEALGKLADVFGIVKGLDVLAGAGNGDASNSSKKSKSRE